MAEGAEKATVVVWNGRRGAGLIYNEGDLERETRSRGGQKVRGGLGCYYHSIKGQFESNYTRSP